MLKINKRNPLLWLYLFGAILLLVGGYLWCFRSAMDPERVFWGTVQHSLATKGVTIESEQSGGGTTVHQTIQYSFGSANMSHSITKMSQAGTTVRNEMLATPTADYSRYLGIKTDQKKADGSALDFSKIIGVWAKGQEGAGQFFDQAVFGSSLPVGGMGLPIANISADMRGKLYSQIRNDAVYQVDFKNVKKTSRQGRSVYTYKVVVQPVAYAKLMKSYAKVLGLHSLDQLEPDQFRGQKPFTLSFTIDARARQVVEIATPDTGLKQTYTSYGVPVHMQLPSKTITGQELQKRLSELQ